MDTIRIGIIGAGGNTKAKHIPNLQNINWVEVVSVCNRSKESSQKVADQFGIPKVYEDWKELINADDTDAIVIGTWPYMHHPITMAALAAGKHVMCEARMARNAHEAREMFEAAQATPECVTQVVPSPFTLGIDATVKRRIEEGYLGDILAIEIKDKGGFINKESLLQWRHDFDISGYNTMALGIWYEAVMRWVGTAAKVSALGKVFVTDRLDPESGVMKSVRISDHMDVVADMECGAQMHIGLSQVSGFEEGSEVALFGSKGTLKFANNRLLGGQNGDEGLKEITIPKAELGGWRVEEEFINAIRGKEQITHTTFEDGLKYMEFTEAVVRSMEKEKAISIPFDY